MPRSSGPTHLVRKRVPHSPHRPKSRRRLHQETISKLSEIEEARKEREANDCCDGGKLGAPVMTSHEWPPVVVLPALQEPLEIDSGGEGWVLTDGNDGRAALRPYVRIRHPRLCVQSAPRAKTKQKPKALMRARELYSTNTAMKKDSRYAWRKGTNNVTCGSDGRAGGVFQTAHRVPSADLRSFV